MKMFEKNIPIEELIDDFDKYYYGKLEELKRVEELAIDISKNGLKHSLIVCKEGNHYDIVEGLHRLRALKKLGWREIPCIVVDWKAQAHPYPTR